MMRRVPVVFHGFAGVIEARQAIDVDREGTSLTIEAPPFPVNVGQRVVLVFQVGKGPVHQALGEAEMTGPLLTIGFAGGEARTVLDAIGLERAPRRYVRHACRIPVVVQTEDQRQALAMASDVGLGGTRLEFVSQRLVVGANVDLRFGDHPEDIAARVVWSSPGGAVGLVFEVIASNLLPVRRLIAAVKARAKTAAA